MIIMKSAKGAKNTGIVHLFVPCSKRFIEASHCFSIFLTNCLRVAHLFQYCGRLHSLMGTVAVAAVAASMRQERFRQTFYGGKGSAKILLALLLLLPSSMRILFGNNRWGKVMQTTLRVFTRFGLVCLLVIGLQVMASAQGRGRGGGGSKGGPPAGTGVDRGIGRSSDASAGRADKGRGTASDKSKGRSDAGRERARDAKEKAKSVAKDRRREHKHCVKDCDQVHKNAVRACRGRTGADRAACERAANEAHRNCVQGCPR